MMAPIASRTGDKDQTTVTMNGGGVLSTAGGGGVVGLAVPSDGVREVEGRSESPSDVVKLMEEKAQLEEQLHVQNNVSALVPRFIQWQLNLLYKLSILLIILLL